ncbi:MAG: chemotaxis protein CheX [Candidatus Hydrogenedentes bacterium]|nr:chemotaxis protein CheX [Candidatus Hydrogenedentota bacterium]
MKVDTKAVLRDVFPRMLEELTFLFADNSDGKASLPGDAVLVNIAFSGPFHGTLDMSIARSLGIEMASNLLGLDPEDTNAQRAGDDALRELMNVTCGHVLTGIAGSEPVFNLSIPTVRPIGAEEWDALGAAADVVIFEVDGRPVQLCVKIEE